MRVKHAILPILAVVGLSFAPAAIAAGGGAGLGTTSKKQTVRASATSSSGGSGGAGVAAVRPASTPSHPMVSGSVARIIHGVAYAPSNAPIQVQRAIWAGNKIRHKPYVWGGGHGSFNDSGYDCSGSVSYVLHAAGLLHTPMDSSEFMSWGHRGTGQWITVYTNPGHAYVNIAGIRLDTSAEGDPHPARGSGPRWRPVMPSNSGYRARHPRSF